MGWEILKSTAVFILIVLGFILFLLIPREMQVTNHGGFVFTAEYPFSFDLYKENINSFIEHFKNEKGFGENRYKVPIIEELMKTLKRDLYIIIPAFLFSMVLGTAIGVIQFYFRDRFIGKIQASLSWFFSSVPDFFFFIAVQYLLIKLFHLGLPRFSLYGNDHWYNFIIPMMAVSLFPLVHMIKFTAASMENEAGQDYVRTARSKGLLTLAEHKHMILNCLSSLLNQTQFIMLYILTSLPIIEKLSSYQGAGWHLLDSIDSHDDVKALAFMLPYLLLMFVTIVLSKLIKNWLVPQKSGVSK